MTGPADRPAVEPDRWNLNLVAVAVVAAVVLAAVAAWILTGDGDEETGGGPSDVPTTTVPPPTSADPGGVDAPTTTAVASTPPTTSAQPMPEVTTSTPAPTTTTLPSTTAPVTTAASAGPDAVPGDLGIAGRPMQRPPCDGAYITIVASALGGDVSAAGIAGLLEQYPGSEYLRTDQTCPSLAQSRDGEPIYVVYLGPFAFDSDACAARASGPADAYARRLTDDPDGGNVNCPPLEPATGD